MNTPPAESSFGKRRQREFHTVLAMIRLYCRDKHGCAVEECAECHALQDYAFRRLAGCVFQEGKPTCQRCPIHCYKPDMRTRITDVMRYAGPRMLFRHPGWACCHLLDGWKPIPPVPKQRAR